MVWYWVAGGAVVILLGLLSRRGESGPEGSGRRQQPADIDGLLKAGRKIEAIKLYRAQHGVDLKAAKDAVEARERQLGR